MFQVAKGVDAFWRSDTEIDKSALASIASRISSLDRETLAALKKTFEKVETRSLSDPYVAVMIAKTPRLFSADNKVVQVEVDRVIKRLGLVPEDVVVDLSGALKTTRIDAALRVAESDVFFNIEQLRATELNRALASVKAVRGSR